MNTLRSVDALPVPGAAEAGLRAVAQALRVAAARKSRNARAGLFERDRLGMQSLRKACTRSTLIQLLESFANMLLIALSWPLKSTPEIDF